MKIQLHFIKLFAIGCLVALNHAATAQGYTWMKGSNLGNQPGAYGTLATPSAVCNPGSRFSAVSWKDNSGNFWLFGGNGYDFIANQGYLNDMWKYEPANNIWIWMKGDNLIAQLGNYGTLGLAAPGNKPGGRTLGATWADNSGNLYMFGGYGYDAAGTLGYLNDLWRYNTVSNHWTWISGSNLAFQAGVYGTVTVSSPGNMPGGRLDAATWMDAAGNLWLFGGLGATTPSTSVGVLNDLWKYDVGTGTWTWMSGSNLIDQNGTYGTLGTPSASNTPGGRQGKMSWKDAAGNFWLFGGTGFDAASTTSGALNDLWKFDVGTGNWTWMNGNTTRNQPGIYGNNNVPASGNTPGGRTGAVTWTDGGGNLWLGFGEGYGITPGSTGKLNDLWILNPVSNQWKWVAGGGGLNFPAIYGTQGSLSANNIPGSRKFAAANWVDANNNLWLFGGTGELTNTGNVSSLNDMWKYTNCQINPITLTLSTSNSVVCAGETVTITALGASNYTWSTGSTVPSIFVAPPTTSVFTAYTSGSNNCTYSGSFTQTIDPCTVLKEEYASPYLTIFPNPGTGEFRVQGATGNETIEIYNLLGELVYNKSLAEKNQSIPTELIPGLYNYSILSGNKQLKSGRLIVQRE